MIKKQLWIVPLILIPAIFVAACGVEEAHNVAEPLNRDEWPTPVPTEAPATATPFPEFEFTDKAPTPTPAPVEEPTPTEVPVESVVSLEPETGSDAVPEVLVSQITQMLRDELSPVSVALVVPDTGVVRQGPGAGYGAAANLERSSLVGVLGQNPGGDWLYVIDMDLNTGWMPTGDLRPTGSIEGAPVLPPDPIAALIEQAAGASNTGAASSQTREAQPVAVEELDVIATAQVDNFALNVRQGPGANFKLLDTLAEGDEVSILALNKDELWALVETAAGQKGWVSIEFLAVEGDLAAAPQVLSALPDDDYPADQIAPITSVSGQPVTVASASDGGSAAASTAAVNVSNQATLPARLLAPVAEGKVSRVVDLRREPDATALPIASLVDEPVTVLAVNQARDWAVVQTTKSRVGWLPVDGFVLTEGSLDNAPPVITAWVESNELKLKSGPGIYHDDVGVVAIDNLVAVVARNEGGNWVLVEPLPGGRGWISPKFLTMMAPLAEIPLVSTLSFPEPVQTQAEPAPAVPLRPAQNLIAFQESSGGNIMLINADGSNLRRLTNGIDPVLSPDGQAVAFTRWQGEVGSLWTINIDGSSERALLGQMRKAKGPAWSPDGTQIVLNYQHGGRLEDETISFDLSENPDPKIPWNAKDVEVVLEPVTDSAGNVVGMEPILKVTLPPDPHWGLRVVNVADGSFKDVDGGTYAFRPTWDPVTDWRVVSDGGRGLVGVDVNRPEYQRTLTDNVNDSSPVFSPDGRYMAVTSKNQGGYDIYRLNADGSGRACLTQTPLWETSGPGEESGWNNVAPAWSPDASQIAFLTDRTGRWEIWVMNVDGSNPQPLFSEAVNDQLNIQYNFVDERVLSWR